MRQVIKFLQEVRAEFRNISWPKKEALIQLTFVVISISLIISLILGGFDYLFTQAIALIGQPTKSSLPANQVPPVVTIIPTAGADTATPSIKLKPTIILKY